MTGNERTSGGISVIKNDEVTGYRFIALESHDGEEASASGIEARSSPLLKREKSSLKRG